MVNVCEKHGAQHDCVNGGIDDDVLPLRCHKHEYVLERLQICNRRAGHIGSCAPDGD